MTKDNFFKTPQLLVLPLFILGLFALQSFKSYLTEKNRIEATTRRANCIIEKEKIGSNEFGPCMDIVEGWK